jgi:outer membrane protein TolC
VFDPSWNQQELISLAVSNHPQVRSARAAEDAATSASRASKMSYLPTLNLSAGWSGSAREIGNRASVVGSAEDRINGQRASCERNNQLAAVLPGGVQGYPRDCSTIVFNNTIAQQAIAANNVFPFNFTEQPPSFTAFISIPIFDGFTRERQMQTARAAADDAKYTRRNAELTQQTLVATAYGNVIAARRSVEIEERNVQAAQQQLMLTQERYRLGASTFVDLATSQQLKAQADRAYVNALYAFHENVAALEAAVGQPLRR